MKIETVEKIGKWLLIATAVSGAITLILWIRAIIEIRSILHEMIEK